MKRRFFAVLICCLLLFGCVTPVFAASGASFVENISTVTSDASCQVTLRVSIHLDEKVKDLTFPLPLGAKDIEFNNSSARATKADGAMQVDISDEVDNAGDYSLKFEFRLDDVVRYEDEKYILELPLLSGFRYPVDAMEFTITLPDEVKRQPTFTGGYRQSTVESIMTVVVQGNMISGTVNQTLDDRETLTMTLEVPEDMFPTVSTFQREGNPEIIPMCILGALALVYWCVFLRTFPLLRTRRATPPEGISAGELGCRLTLSGADLTMMVVHWAQLGYILIHLDDNGRVILHKRMDMGNERSLFEVKTFRALFGKRRVVDGTGYQYARLARKLARQIPGERSMCSGKSGNVKIFRILSCAVMALCGVCLAMNMTGQEVLQTLLAVILGIFGGFSAWHIQGGMYRVHLRNQLRLYLALALSAVWLILGLVAGQFLIALIPTLWQLLTGLMAAYGGRRTDMGRINAVQILGLRHHLRTVQGEELHRLRKNDPEYFFNMAPFALALGVEKKFAGKFGRKKLQACPYLAAGLHSRMDALHWAQLMREVVDILDARQKRMEWERFAIVRIK